MPIVYVNIGSNLGERENLINRAIEEIGDRFGYCCISGLVESEPWGFDSANRFLNIGISFKTLLHPEEILDTLKKIEKKISGKSHRDSQGNYSDREVDIDIMAIDEITYDSERLHIPHKHLLEREFFLIPLKELSPSWKYPSIR